MISAHKKTVPVTPGRDGPLVMCDSDSPSFRFHEKYHDEAILGWTLLEKFARFLESLEQSDRLSLVVIPTHVVEN
jgi:hypothetical protein